MSQLRRYFLRPAVLDLIYSRLSSRGLTTTLHNPSTHLLGMIATFFNILSLLTIGLMCDMFVRTRKHKAELRTRQSCGFFVPVIYGRVERRNTIPAFAGNMPGATLCALVDTRLPIKHWKPPTKNTKEVIYDH